MEELEYRFELLSPLPLLLWWLPLAKGGLLCEGKREGSKRFSLLAYGLKALPGPPRRGESWGSGSTVFGTNRVSTSIKLLLLDACVSRLSDLGVPVAPLE